MSLHLVPDRFVKLPRHPGETSIPEGFRIQIILRRFATLSSSR